jgi:hypothetical protein
MRPRGHRASITQTAKGRQAVRGVAGVAVEFFVDPGHVGPGSATGADPLEQPRRDQGRTESAITLGAECRGDRLRGRGRPAPHERREGVGDQFGGAERGHERLPHEQLRAPAVVEKA